MDLDLFERDCEQAYYRLLEEKKRLIREGGFWEGWIDDPPLLAYTQYRYRTSNRYEEERARVILEGWRARASAELRDYWETCKRDRRAAEDDRRRQKAREEEAKAAERRRRELEEEAEESERRRERKRKEEERRRKEEEERCRQEEEERKAEARRKEQDKKNREELKRIQEEWNARRSSIQSPQPQQSTDTIFCSACGAVNAKSAKFCTECGTRIQIECPSCGGLIRVGSKFCCWCGSPVSVAK